LDSASGWPNRQFGPQVSKSEEEGRGEAPPLEGEQFDPGGVFWYARPLKFLADKGGKREGGGSFDLHGDRSPRDRQESPATSGAKRY
jgi:hypothetical protein